MNDIDKLSRRVEAIEKRNMSVTLDKNWETSWMRKISIVVATYIVVWMYLYVIGNDNPWVNAIVPPVGFVLSTLALGKIRQYWQSKQTKTI